jgi:hypothetical protein
MTERIFVFLMGLPHIMRLGLLILVIGGMLDLLYHAAPPGWALQMDGYLGADGVGAHLLTLLGMVVTLLGLLAHRPRPSAAHMEIPSPEGRSAIEQ